MPVKMMRSGEKTSIMAWVRDAAATLLTPQAVTTTSAPPSVPV